MPIKYLNFCWVILLFAGVNYAFGWYRMAKPFLPETGGTITELKKLCRGLSLGAAIPYAVMGLASILNPRLTIVHFFDPLSHHLGVKLFFFSTVVLWIITSVWILQGGDEKLSKYPGIFPPRGMMTCRRIRLMWTVSIVSGMIGYLIMLLMRPLILEMISALEQSMETL